MKDLFTIDSEEKNRILILHETATKNLYLLEQIITNFDSKYDYKKENDNYFFKLKNSDSWSKAVGTALTAIKTKVFKDIPTNNINQSTQSSVDKKQNSSPFKNREEGNRFRKWVNNTLPSYAKKLKLDPEGSFNNSFIINAWNYNLPLKSGDTMKLGDYYNLKNFNNNSTENSITIMPGFSPNFKNKINFDNLKITDTTKNFCKPNDKECAQFINDISDDISPGDVGNAWNAYINTTKLGNTIYSSFKNIGNRKNDVIKLWQQINNRPGNQKWEKKGKLSDEISTLVNSLVPKKYDGPKLNAGDIVGIYYPNSDNHERAFYEGGERWFVDGKPGNTINKGEGWGMNTHIGRVAVVKDGVPLIFHNVDGTTKSDPPQNLRIAWVKRKGGKLNENFLSEQPDSVMDRRLGIITPPKSLPKKFQCLTNELSAAAQYVISHGINPFFTKYSLGIIGRESDFGKVMGMYGVKAIPEYVMNKMSEIIPGFKNVLQWGAKKSFGKDNWVPSMGVAQMTPNIAKKYNVNLEDLMSISGSLLAVSNHLQDLYKETSKFYDTNKPSKIIYNNKLIDNPSSSGNAALDAAIMSYNLGLDKFKKQYCSTDNPQFMAPCNSKNGIYLPYPNDKPNFKLKVNPNNVIKNYTPTIRTKTGDNQYISNTGYLKEVVGYANKFSCVK